MEQVGWRQRVMWGRIGTGLGHRTEQEVVRQTYWHPIPLWILNGSATNFEDLMVNTYITCNGREGWPIADSLPDFNYLPKMMWKCSILQFSWSVSHKNANHLDLWGLYFGDLEVSVFEPPKISVCENNSRSGESESVCVSYTVSCRVLVWPLRSCMQGHERRLNHSLVKVVYSSPKPGISIVNL